MQYFRSDKKKTYVVKNNVKKKIYKIKKKIIQTGNSKLTSNYYLY